MYRSTSKINSCLRLVDKRWNTCAQTADQGPTMRSTTSRTPTTWRAVCTACVRSAGEGTAPLGMIRYALAALGAHIRRRGLRAERYAHPLRQPLRRRWCRRRCGRGCSRAWQVHLRRVRRRAPKACRRCSSRPSAAWRPSPSSRRRRVGVRGTARQCARRSPRRGAEVEGGKRMVAFPPSFKRRRAGRSNRRDRRRHDKCGYTWQSGGRARSDQGNAEAQALSQRLPALPSVPPRARRAARR